MKLINSKNNLKMRSVSQKKVLNPALCLLLSLILALSSAVTYVADDNISSSDRIVRLTTKDIDGNFTNNDDDSKNKYELEIQKTLNSFNELCLEYSIGDFSNVDDIVSEIEIVMSNVSFKDAVLTLSDANAIIGDPSVVTENSTSRLIMRINRNYVSNLDKVVINVPFKITNLTDIGDITINLKSAASRTVSYTWDTVLVNTIENPEDLPEFDRFNNGTYFKNSSMKVAKGLYHSIPVRVLSKSNEGETFVKLEHPAFYFENYDGTWTLGQGVQKIESLNALEAKIIDFHVFQTQDSTTPMKVKVNDTHLTSTMQLEQTRIILNTSPTITNVKVGEENIIDATLKLETPFTANNSFKINIGADSNKFEFKDISQNTSLGDDKSIQFTIPYKTKKAFNAGIISLDVVTEFEGKTYDIISKDLTFVSTEDNSNVDPEPDLKDYYIDSLVPINQVENGASKNLTFNLVNNSKEAALIKVKIKSSNPNVILESEHLGFNVESNTEYTITANIDANSLLTIPYSINVSATANTSKEDKANSLTFSILTQDDVTDNNVKTLSYTISPEPSIIDYYVEDLPLITPVDNGDSRDSFFIIVNNSDEDASIKVKIKSSDTKVTLNSIYPSFNIEGNNEYSVTANVTAKSTVKVPYTLIVGKTANTGTTIKENTLTFTIATHDDVTDNNVKVLSYTITPEENPEPIPTIKDYYIGALSSIASVTNGASRNSTFNVVNNSNEKATIYIKIKSSDDKVAVDSTYNGFSKINETEYTLALDIAANSSIMIPYTLTVDKSANTGTTDKTNTLTFTIITSDDITDNNVKTLSYIVTPDEIHVPEPTTKDYYISALSTILPLPNGTSKDALFNVVNNSNENATISIKIDNSDKNVTINSTYSGFDKVSETEYTLTVEVSANSSVIIPYSITANKTTNTGTTDKVNTLTFTIITSDDITDNNIKTLSYTVIPDDSSNPDPTPTTKDYYISSLQSITPLTNGASKNSTFNIVNNSDENAVINVKIVSSDENVILDSNYNSFSKLNETEYSLVVEVSANSSIMIPYSIIANETANTGTVDKVNTLTFTIITPDDITDNNVKTLSYTINPDISSNPDPTPTTKDYYISSLQSITPLTNGASKNSTFNILNNSGESATIRVRITNSDENVTLDSNYDGFNRLNTTEYIFTVNVSANDSITVPYSMTANKKANTGTKDKINTLTFTIATPDDITDNNVKVLSYTISPNNTSNPDPVPTTKDYYVNSLQSITPLTNGGTKNSTFSLVNNSDESAVINVKIVSSDENITINSNSKGFSKLSTTEYTIMMEVSANSSMIIPYSITANKTANIGTTDKVNTLTFTILNFDDVTDNNVKTLSYTITPDKTSSITPTTKDYYIGALPSIVPVTNGASKNSTFNVINNSDEDAIITVDITSSDDTVVIDSTHSGFDKVNATKYTLTVEVSANSSVMIPYSIKVGKTTNTGTTDKINTLTFTILTLDDVTDNNIKVLSYTISPDKTSQKPSENPDNPVSQPIDLNQYFAIELIADRTPVLNKEVTVAISSSRLQNLQNLVENPRVELTVTGPKIKDYSTDTYKITKNLAYLDTNTLSAQSIAFTALSEGDYTVTAKVTGTNLTSNGYLYTQKQFSIKSTSEEGIYPQTPIVGSGKVNVDIDLIGVNGNEATLKVIATNDSEYLLRNASLAFSYDTPVIVNIDPTSAIITEFYIGNLNKNSRQEFTFPVKIKSSGRPNITVSLNSTDLNTDVYTPSDSYNTPVTYIEESKEPTKTAYKVSGIVFDDINGDGLYSSSDNPISSATVHLKGKVGNIIQTMFSYTSGYYSFSNIVPGDYTIEVNYIGLTTKKKVTITDSDQASVNIPVPYSYNNNSSNSGGNSNNDIIGSNNNNNNNSSNNSEEQPTYYKDVSLTGSLQNNGINNYAINLQIANSNTSVVTDAALRVTTYNAQLQSTYDYIRTSDNSYIINVPSFVSLRTLLLYITSNNQNNASMTVELICPTDLNTSNNVVSFALIQPSANESTQSNLSTMKGTLKKKITEDEITIITSKDETETYSLTSDVIFELDDEESSMRKINSAFNDDLEISVRLYRDAIGTVYKVIASSNYIEDENNISNDYIADFGNLINNNNIILSPDTSNNPEYINNTMDSQIVPVSESTVDAIYNNSNNIPHLPKTGVTSKMLSGIYPVISFTTGFSAIILFAYSILLKYEEVHR